MNKWLRSVWRIRGLQQKIKNEDGENSRFAVFPVEFYSIWNFILNFIAFGTVVVLGWMTDGERKGYVER